MNIIEKFNWKCVASILGSSHSSIIGFIAYEWLKHNPNSALVLDGAPTPLRDEEQANNASLVQNQEKKDKHIGQVYSDLILLQDENTPKVIVEVETTQWESKIDSLVTYLNHKYYSEAEGLLVITKLRKTKGKDGIIAPNENDSNLLEKIKGRIVEENRKNENLKMSIVEIWRIRKPKENSATFLEKIKKQSDYYNWEIDCISWWGLNNQAGKQLYKAG